MKGLKIKTVTGYEFEVYGDVTFKDFPDEGRVYYCAGQSFPSEIVQKIIGDEYRDRGHEV
jgi:hypothetical protein